MKNQVRIVGIGASAGGLEAIYEFFENLSNNTGFAFVIIQHLSPDFKSLMHELLPKYTSMPIEIIENMVSPKPNHIYLISSKRNLIIKNGIFQPVNRTQTPYLNLPIDVFFQSLGKDQQEKAIGIILSGSGTDGSRGVRTIKEQGGLVLCQDPESAQFRSMPDAAIALGFADSVLPPFALARELVRISELPFQGNITIINPSIEKNQQNLARILNKVAEISGVDFNEYRKGTLLRRTEKRMMINNFHTLEDYYHYILENEEECKTLFKEFLIGVTRFFRDTEAFELLRTKIIPQIINSTSVHKPIRIWVTGCSTGEEAYSIAILFLEYLEQHKLNRQFKIFASDIDKEAIAFAGAGIYHDNILADVAPARIRKYFVNQQNIFRVKKVVREKIVFALHDAMKDPPFMNINLVSCRNVLIYLNSKIQQNLLANFQFALNYEGYLLLGPSESIGQLSSMFKAVDNKWNIYQNVSREKVNMALRGGIRRSRQKTEVGKYEPEGLLKNSFRHVENKFTALLANRFAPLALFVNEHFDILYINGNFEAILKLPSGFGKLNLLDMIGENDPLIFKTGIRNIKDNNKISHYEDFILVKGDTKIKADIQFEKWRPSPKEPTIYLITFFIKEKADRTQKKEIVKQNDFSKEQLSLLQSELEEVNREKQSLVEQLETTNEELQSSNEELLAANEELQSANEELQSVNEELYTVNTELQSKIDELVVVNADTSNLLKSTDIGTVFLDMGLRIRRFTPTLKEQFDLLESDIGRPITNFNHTFNDNQIFEDIAKVLKTLNTLEREIIGKDGKHHLMRVLPYRTEDNKVDGIVLTFINIEQLHQMTNELKYRSSLFQAVFNNTTAHIFIVDNELNIKEINHISPGLNKDIVMGQQIFNFVPVNLHDKVKQIVAQLSKKEIIVGTYETEETLITGEQRWYQYSVIPVYDNQVVPNFIFIGRDITFFKKNTLHLQQLEQQMEQEIQAKLIGIIGQKQILETKSDFLEAFLEGILTKIDTQISKEKGETSIELEPLLPLLERSKELVDYQKDADKLIREIDAKDIFLEVRGALQSMIQTTNATIRYSFGKHRKLRYVKAHFYEILFTLMDNALNYRTPDAALTIKITTDKKEDFFTLTVEDDGIGIDLKKNGHLLFKPFSPLTLNQRGLGLSLSIIDNLVRKTGGIIEVDSQLGKGSSFKVYIPTAFRPSETVQLSGFSES